MENDDLNRYERVVERIEETQRELRRHPNAGPPAFDNEAWLRCEHESLRLEQQNLGAVMNADGSVSY
jgi:hypothetical protein